MITHINAEREFYSHIGCLHFKELKLSIKEWLNLMRSGSVFADKLMLYALAHTYQQHVVVFTSMRCWSTVGFDEPITGACLLEICEVHLLYIGQHMYGDLKLCPFVPIKGHAITEAPTIYIPSNDEDSKSTEAIDLSKKPESAVLIPETTDTNGIDNVSYKCNNNFDRTSSPSSPSSTNVKFTDNNSTDSDTPLESLLSPPVAKHILGTNTVAESNVNTQPVG